ncbi:torsin-like protein [Diachasma alloeum]|uniref:torsin-like protein n=1 Tax=Diachasma alloeum TaxID=454923 RepID=UPI000738143B|nr:torsin-like protein [Diachasma alloeum]
MKMRVRTAGVCCIFLSMFLEESEGLIDPITGGLVASLAGLFYYGYNQQKTKCDRQECCESRYIEKNISYLRKALGDRLFGQHIASKTIVSALGAHRAVNSPNKPLTMSFHGLAGTGKNYVAQMIAFAYFKKGQNSKYYHFFNGRTEFPLASRLEFYQEDLRDRIYEALIDCPDSLFVFDEVDMMTSGVLDALVPFLDYGNSLIYWQGRNRPIEKNRAVYIFLSNTGSQEIVNTLTQLWEQGKSRNETTLSDFERLILTGAFNEKGGFHKSDTIRTNVIDHFVPFLPLEEEHVISCVKAAFDNWNKNPTPEMIQEAMAYVTYSPPHNLYAKSGCKRIEQKVNSIVYQRGD